MNKNAKYVLGVMLFVVPLLVGASYGIGEAAGYPSKTIEFIVPFAAGSSADSGARVLAIGIEKELGQKVLVVNKAGGSGEEGREYAAKAKPDGYTMIAVAASTVNTMVTRKVNYTFDSFDAILQYSDDASFIFVGTESPIKTLDDFIAKAKTGSLTLATVGHMTAHHLSAVLLEKRGGYKFRYVHGSATGAAAQVAGGHVDACTSGIPHMSTMMRAGKLRIVATSARKRDPRYPEVPSWMEKGIDNFVPAARGVFVPAGTPPEIREKLYQAFMKALASDDVKKKFENMGMAVDILDGKEYMKALREYQDTMKPILLEQAKIQTIGKK
jgi:tripartite-type tricarboxylate transporter receptor subunit TctC